MFTFAIVLNHNFNQFMKKQLVFILMSLLFVVGAYAQRMVTVQGVVTDATMGHRTKRILRIERKEYQTY